MPGTLAREQTAGRLGSARVLCEDSASLSHRGSPDSLLQRRRGGGAAHKGMNSRLSSLGLSSQTTTVLGIFIYSYEALYSIFGVLSPVLLLDHIFFSLRFFSSLDWKSPWPYTVPSSPWEESTTCIPILVTVTSPGELEYPAGSLATPLGRPRALTHPKDSFVMMKAQSPERSCLGGTPSSATNFPVPLIPHL